MWVFRRPKSERLDLGGVDMLRCGYLGDLNLRDWMWEALIRLDVGI